MNVDDAHKLRSAATIRVRRVAASMAPPGARSVLDAACGTGLLFRETDACHGAVRVCLDKAPELLAHVGPGCTAVLGDLFAPPDLPGPFDVIFLLNTLYNLGDAESAVRAIESLSRHLAPGGVMLADIRNAANPLVRLRYFIERVRGRFAPVAHSLQEVKSALDARGLVVRRAEHIGWLVPFAYVLEIGFAGRNK